MPVIGIRIGKFKSNSNSNILQLPVIDPMTESYYDKSMMCVFFVLLLDEWTIPDISGQCMPPNNNFVMEMIHNTRVIIFGGIIEDGTTSNTVYIVDIINNTLVCYIIIYILTNNIL